MTDTIFETDFKTLNLLKRGKVRDIYDLGEYYLIVATDRLSAFDVVLPDAIPMKGKVLTQISLFWFKQIEDIIPNHVVMSNVDEFPNVCKPYSSDLRDRSIIVKKANPIPVECVVRGYISGSAWSSYIESKEICGVPLPDGLKESDKLPNPIFTPSTKEECGEHDINISFDEVKRSIGEELGGKIKDVSLRIYEKCSKIADKYGIIIADTKFEFGLFNNELIIIDEMLTPDSSRFWPKVKYSPGGPQESYDKQFVRDYLLSIKWDKKAPGPKLPEEIINKTSLKYIEAMNLFKN